MNFYGFRVEGLTIHTLAMGGFLIFLVFAAVATIVMMWHWRRYGFGMKGIAIAEITYLTGLVVLLGGCFFELRFLISPYV